MTSKPTSKPTSEERFEQKKTKHTEMLLGPEEIEAESFRIIAAELSDMGITLPAETDPVIRRVIHTTADFSYAETMRFSENAVEVLRELLRNGARIVTDTQMALSGINKRKLADLGGEVHCFMSDPEVAVEAKKRSVTRAAVSMERAAKLPQPVIFVIGNAPTALLRLRDLIESGEYRPAFIIGVPVGFVNVEYAKDCIMELGDAKNIPYIVNEGRKGGSNVAAAIVNAVMYTLRL